MQNNKRNPFVFDRKSHVKMGTRVVALFKRGWSEIPEIMGSSFMGLVGLGFSAIGTYLYYKNEAWNRPYKILPVVMRSDDPRADNVRKINAKFGWDD